MPEPRPVHCEAARQNSLKTRGAALVRLLNALDSAELRAGGKANRGSARWPFRVECVVITLQHQGGTSVDVGMIGRNISRGGVALLHNTYMHTGTRCRVLLQHLKKGPTPVAGTVARCQHRIGIVHEIGVKFDEPIRVRDFVNPDPFANAFTLEKVDPRSLTGMVLYVDPDATERHLVKHFLRETALKLAIAEGLGSLPQGMADCDLAIASAEIPGSNPGEIVQALRDGGVMSPIVMVTPDSGPATRQQIARVRAQAFLARPLNDQTLLRAIAEWTIVERAAWGMFRGAGAGGTAPNGKESHGLAECGKALDAALTSGDVAAAQRACLQTMQVGELLGAKSVTAMCDQVLRQLGQGASIEQVRAPLGALVAVCKAVAPGAAAA